MTTNKKFQKEILEKIDQLLKEETVSFEEKKILYAFKRNNNDSFLKKVYVLKLSLRDLQIEKGLVGGLSEKILDFYSYIQRKAPTTGPSSIFNGLIK